jgi:hypothetical protein
MPTELPKFKQRKAAVSVVGALVLMVLLFLAGRSGVNCEASVPDWHNAIDASGSAARVLR